tara:strand:+ start:303 stop:875 length:573 start_codon:yes stop_codon:yes gene_type:complete
MNYKELVTQFGKGLMSRVQYEEIAKELEPICPCNVLVFGLGKDSYLWQNLNKGGLTVFLEDDNDWASKFSETDLNIYIIQYKTKVEEHDLVRFDEEKIKIDLPAEVTSVVWDFIIVDAPLGHQPPRPYKGPGRMSSIFSAYSLIKDNGIVVIDDFGRDVEKIYSKHYFGEENLFKVVEKKVAFFKNKKNG